MPCLRAPRRSPSSPAPKATAFGSPFSNRRLSTPPYAKLTPSQRVAAMRERRPCNGVARRRRARYPALLGHRCVTKASLTQRRASPPGLSIPCVLALPKRPCTRVARASPRKRTFAASLTKRRASPPCLSIPCVSALPRRRCTRVARASPRRPTHARSPHRCHKGARVPRASLFHALTRCRSITEPTKRRDHGGARITRRSPFHALSLQRSELSRCRRIIAPRREEW